MSTALPWSLTLTDAERTEYWSGRGPIFKDGQKVVCLDSDGYIDLKRGEVFTVDKYIPKNPTENYTWPAYVEIKFGDRKICCHATRFKAIPEPAQPS